MHTGSMCIETYPNHESRGAKAWVLLDRMIQGVRSDALRVRLRQLHPTFHQQCGSRDFRLDNQHGSLVHSRIWPGITKGGGAAWRSWRQSWCVGCCFGFGRCLESTNCREEICFSGGNKIRSTSMAGTRKEHRIPRECVQRLFFRAQKHKNKNTPFLPEKRYCTFSCFDVQDLGVACT